MVICVQKKATELLKHSHHQSPVVDSLLFRTAVPNAFSSMPFSRDNQIIMGCWNNIVLAGVWRVKFHLMSLGCWEMEIRDVECRDANLCGGVE